MARGTRFKNPGETSLRLGNLGRVGPGKAILRDTSKRMKPGGRVTSGKKLAGTREGSKGSINSGGNYGPVGHTS